MFEFGGGKSMDKQQTNIETKSVPDLTYEDGEPIQGQKGGTRNDVYDMTRMGKKQELRVRI